MGEPAPLQPDLPFDLEAAANASPATPPQPPVADSSVAPAEPVSVRPAWRPAVVEDPGPPLSQQLLDRIRALPWSRWRGTGARALGAGGGATAILARFLRVAVAAGGSGLARFAPYAAALARNTARAGLVRAALRWSAIAVHAAGFPGVVLRTAVQFSVVHRAGLTVESVTYFEAQDPAGYVVYEAPKDLGTGLAVAYLPTVVLLLLSLLCLAPALTPRAVLHLHPGLLTWLQIWTGLAFATHAMPTHEEAAPLAEQARVGVAKAEPLALIAVVPAQLIAWISRFGGLAPALLGAALAIWLSGLIFR